MALFANAGTRLSGKNIGMLEACGDVNGLVRALAGRDKAAVAAATEALGRIGGPAVAPLLQLCNGKDYDLQLSAAIALGRIRSREAVPALIRLSYSPDVGVRMGACLSLGPIDDERAINTLVYHLADRDQEVRDSAALSLVAMGDRAVAPVVAGLARANQRLRDVGVALRSARALGQFDAAIVARNALCADQLARIVDGVGLFLAGAGRPLARGFLRRLFCCDTARDADWAVLRGCSIDVDDLLLDMIGDENDEVVERVARSLGHLQVRRAIRPLERLLDDDNAAIRAAAAAALGQITPVGLAKREVRAEERRVAVMFECEYCHVPVECGSPYCPACGALFI